MGNNEKAPIRIIIFFLALTFTIFGIAFFVLPRYTKPNNYIINTWDNTDWALGSGKLWNIKSWEDTSVINLFTGDIIESMAWDNLTSDEFTFITDCIPHNTWEYKILNVFTSPQNSPSNPRNYISYTKSFTIIWNISGAQLCVVSDVIDYRKKHQFTYSTYILFNDKWMDGHINVGFSKTNNVIYDFTSSPREPFLDGRFRWDETPKIYSNIDLSKVRVADFANWWSKEINILSRLQKQWPIKIGWFVNAKNWEGIIKKFVIAYKCEEWSNCEIK